MYIEGVYMRRASMADAESLPSMPESSYIVRFAQSEENLMRTIEGFGVEVEAEDESLRREAHVASLRDSLAARGARLRNDGKSLGFGDLSPACIRCRTGIRSVSSFLSLACGRDCWFCFNPNQHDYDRYRNALRDWRSQLDGYDAELGGLDFIALTGGEPLLHPQEALEFIRYGRALAPESHIRLYTSGAGADAALMEQLAQAGLDEVRFSVKLDDDLQQREALALMEAAVRCIPSVMVEMPVIPGTRDAMAALLQKLDDIGIFGINLLELCFPLHNAAAFRERGLKLKRHPYRVPYSYGYAGALPVAGSEELALELMEDAIARGTGLSLHWCSLENKNTAQIHSQNGGGETAIPPYSFSERSFFYEMVRAFGDDALFCLSRLEAAGIAFEYSEEAAMVAFDPAALDLFEPADADAHRLWLASAVIETDGEGRRCFREAGLCRIEPQDIAQGAIAAGCSGKRP